MANRFIQTINSYYLSSSLATKEFDGREIVRGFKDFMRKKTCVSIATCLIVLIRHIFLFCRIQISGQSN